MNPTEKTGSTSDTPFVLKVYRDEHGTGDTVKIAGYALPAKQWDSLEAINLPTQEYFYRAMTYEAKKCIYLIRQMKKIMDERIREI